MLFRLPGNAGLSVFNDHGDHHTYVNACSGLRKTVWVVAHYARKVAADRAVD